MIYVITVAYCRSAQLARCLMEYSNTNAEQHVFVQAHYPIDTDRNNEEIKLLVESYARKKHDSMDVALLDPGEDLGSAQSQQWALERMDLGEKDYWLNLDPDSICRSDAWETAMEMVLDADPNCAVISCMSPMVQGFLKERPPLIEKEIAGIRVGIPQTPTPFNLSMFRVSFCREMGGLRQLFPSWGELEGIIYQEANMRGKYHAYLLDHMEDESNKYFHPKSNAEWKDLHARTTGPEQFLGSYGEFLAYKYPHLASLKI